MTICARFTLPLPPSTNALFANVPRKGRIKTTAYNDWLDEAGKMIRFVQRVPLVAGEVAVSVTVQRKNKRRRDIDNFAKAILDASVKFGVIEEDSKVVDLHLRYGDVDGVEVFVRRVEPVTVVA